MTTTQTVLSTSDHPESIGCSDAITTVVFDFGGVFTESPIAMICEAATKANVDPDQLIAIMLGDYSERSNHPWHRVERGELSLEDAGAWAKAETLHRLGVEIDPMKVMRPMLEGGVRQSMVELAVDIRAAGLTTVLLTNNARELRPLWSAMADWSTLFDHIVDSSESKIRKPSAAAFQLALSCAGAESPRSALMIDDFQVNLDGAAAIGMKTVLVEVDPAAAIKSIRELVLQ